MAERKPDLQSEAKRQEAGEFPQDPEERFAALLASFNIGPKATTLLLLPQSGYISPGDLTTAFRRIVAGTDMAETDKKTAPSYCHQTLSPIGLVAKEYTIDYFGMDKLVGFGLTEAGKLYGRTAATLALDFELRNKFSLFPIFGSTATSSQNGNRAPYTRARILEALAVKTTALRAADLVKTLDIKHSIMEGTLKSLKNAGVIDYEAVTPNTGKTQISYVLGDLPIDQVEPENRLSSLTRAIANICQDISESSTPITQAQVFENIGRETKNRLQEKVLRKQISSILSGLSRQGFLKRGQFKGTETLSVTQINEKGRLIVREYFLPLQALVEDEKNPALEQITRRVLADLSAYAASSARLYYPYSIGFKIKESQSNQTELRQHLNDKSGQSAGYYAQMLNLHEDTIHNYLSPLIKSGQVRVVRIKGVDYFFPVPNLESSRELVDR